MQVKNKLFPYPVINHNKMLSNMGEKEFLFSFETEETDDAFYLRKARFETDSEYINRLYDENKIEVVCIIECSNTAYRKAFPLNKKGNDIELLKVDFTEKVDISMFATAKEEFALSSEEFEDDYKGLEIIVEKNDIIGANDGFNLTFRHEESEDNFAHSIFSIITNQDMQEEYYSVECGFGRKIVITMSEKEFDNYDLIASFPPYKEVFFNMLLIPALIEGLNNAKNYLNESPGRDLDDVGNSFQWFRAIQKAYYRLKGEELTKEVFNELTIVVLAQELLGKPLGMSLQKLVEGMRTPFGGDEDE